MVRFIGYNLEILSNLRNPANSSRHTVDSQMFDNVSFLRVSSTIAASISMLIGAFIVTGLAKDLHKSSSIMVINGLEVGEWTPAVL